MEIQGVVVSVESNVSIEKRAGGSYQGTRFTFRDNGGKLTEQNFTSQALKYNQSLGSALNNLNAGDTFTMTKEKQGEFWNVTSIVRGGSSGSSGSSPIPVAAGQRGIAPSTGSTYASAEERAATQLSIVRQSNINAAISTLSVGAKTLKPADVLALAKVYEGYVFGKEFGGEDEPQLDEDYAL